MLPTEILRATMVGRYTQDHECIIHHGDDNYYTRVNKKEGSAIMTTTHTKEMMCTMTVWVDDRRWRRTRQSKNWLNCSMRPKALGVESAITVSQRDNNLSGILSAYYWASEENIEPANMRPVFKVIK